MIHDVVSNLSNDLNKKLDDYVIEGLKRKGFKFKNKVELEAFVKERCSCKDNIDIKEKVYYVDNIPFFLHNYQIETLQMPLTTDNEYKITANLGSYVYL
jgi:DNA-binding winged helix-turn-helix (wHTH) protein